MFLIRRFYIRILSVAEGTRIFVGITGGHTADGMGILSKNHFEHGIIRQNAEKLFTYNNTITYEITKKDKTLTIQKHNGTISIRSNGRTVLAKSE